MVHQDCSSRTVWKGSFISVQCTEIKSEANYFKCPCIQCFPFTFQWKMLPNCKYLKGNLLHLVHIRSNDSWSAELNREKNGFPMKKSFIKGRKNILWCLCPRSQRGWPCSQQFNFERFDNGKLGPHLHSTQTSRPSPEKGFWPQSDLVWLVGAAATITLDRVSPIWTAKHSIHVTRPAKPYKRVAELFNFPIFYIKHFISSLGQLCRANMCGGNPCLLNQCCLFACLI